MKKDGKQIIKKYFKIKKVLKEVCTYLNIIHFLNNQFVLIIKEGVNHLRTHLSY